MKRKPANAREAGILRLHKAIRAHVRAQIGRSWQGSQHPEDWPGIEQAARDAAYRLFEAIETLVIYENSSRWDNQENRLRTARERKAYQALASKVFDPSANSGHNPQGET